MHPLRILNCFLAGVLSCDVVCMYTYYTPPVNVPKHASLGVKQDVEEGMSMNVTLLDIIFDAETFRYALVLDDCLHIVMKRPDHSLWFQETSFFSGGY